MKKLSIIFCFFLITLFSLGSFFIYTAYLKSYKKEFQSFIFQNKNLKTHTTIQINPSELYTDSKTIVWEDRNKEVEYKGLLYDIVSVKSIGTKVELTIVSDFQEMQLKKQFASVYDVTSKDSTKEPFNLLKNLLALKWIVNYSSECLNLLEDSITIIAKHPSQQVLKGYSFQETPPPNLLN